MGVRIEVENLVQRLLWWPERMDGGVDSGGSSGNQKAVGLQIYFGVRT